MSKKLDVKLDANTGLYLKYDSTTNNFYILNLSDASLSDSDKEKINKVDTLEKQLNDTKTELSNLQESLNGYVFGTQDFTITDGIVPDTVVKNTKAIIKEVTGASTRSIYDINNITIDGDTINFRQLVKVKQFDDSLMKTIDECTIKIFADSTRTSGNIVISEPFRLYIDNIYFITAMSNNTNLKLKLQYKDSLNFADDVYTFGLSDYMFMNVNDLEVQLVVEWQNALTEDIYISPQIINVTNDYIDWSQWTEDELIDAGNGIGLGNDCGACAEVRRRFPYMPYPYAKGVAKTNIFDKIILRTSNLVDYTKFNPTATVGGLTFKNNGDGSITVTGTGSGEFVVETWEHSEDNFRLFPPFVNYCLCGGAVNNTEYKLKFYLDDHYRSTETYPDVDKANGQTIITQNYITNTSGNLSINITKEVNSEPSNYCLGSKLVICINNKTSTNSLTFWPQLIDLNNYLNKDEEISDAIINQSALLYFNAYEKYKELIIDLPKTEKLFSATDRFYTCRACDILAITTDCPKSIDEDPTLWTRGLNKVMRTHVYKEIPITDPSITVEAIANNTGLYNYNITYDKSLDTAGWPYIDTTNSVNYRVMPLDNGCEFIRAESSSQSLITEQMVGLDSALQQGFFSSSSSAVELAYFEDTSELSGEIITSAEDLKNLLYSRNISVLGMCYPSLTSDTTYSFETITTLSDEILRDAGWRNVKTNNINYKYASRNFGKANPVNIKSVAFNKIKTPNDELNFKNPIYLMNRNLNTSGTEDSFIYDKFFSGRDDKRFYTHYWNWVYSINMSDPIQTFEAYSKKNKHGTLKPFRGSFYQINVNLAVTSNEAIIDNTFTMQDPVRRLNSSYCDFGNYMYPYSQGTAIAFSSEYMWTQAAMLKFLGTKIIWTLGLDDDELATETNGKTTITVKPGDKIEFYYDDKPTPVEPKQITLTGVVKKLNS